MKWTNLLYTGLLALMLTVTGCSKWLDVSPKTDVRANDLLSTEQGFKDALTGIYIKLADDGLYGRELSMGFMDVIAQRYNNTVTSSYYYQASVFNYIDGTNKSVIAGIWGGLYTAIANANTILDKIDDRQDVFSSGNYARIKGEALAIRAYLHFDLLRMFGAAPVVDAQRKAIPYLKHFDVKVAPLLTVKAVMDTCLADLAAAEVLLANDKNIRERQADDAFQTYTRNHMNYWAVKGLQARIQLYAGNKTAAMEAARVVIDNHIANFPWAKPEDVKQVNFPDLIFSKELLFGVYSYGQRKASDYLFTSAQGSPRLCLSKSSNRLETLYETSGVGATDIRRLNQFALLGTNYATTKYAVMDSTEGSALTYRYRNIPMIRLSEMYYIAAECAPSPQDGVVYLDSVLVNRSLKVLPGNISAATLTAEIKKEYQKEMYAEGQLFYYFKRMNAAKIDGSTKATGDAVYIFPLPDNEIEFGNR
ncbi:RagB/SusD family nutrient uptake outer membrane protein [Chitinophaga flava]|uniref:SusD-like N-terminal domain-containing protein n=1 Tax=Chitinophaga flava TaxID=2259036 RepID=A0A365XRG5_9BACT|nr:RagB/SusD family nutrient uptake outer membrane protein [Chitinophaga flava]RBL88946.1 hypothetical protein DF182_20590 [Chitinophaga flava]